MCAWITIFITTLFLFPFFYNRLEDSVGGNFGRSTYLTCYVHVTLYLGYVVVMVGLRRGCLGLPYFVSSSFVFCSLGKAKVRCT